MIEQIHKIYFIKIKILNSPGFIRFGQITYFYVTLRMMMDILSPNINHKMAQGCIKVNDKKPEVDSYIDNEET